MAILLYGEDTYRSRQRLNQIKEEFFKKDPSGVNLRVLEGEALDLEKFQNEINSVPFLSPQRLIMVENFFSSASKDSQEEMIKIFATTSSTTDLVFYEKGNLDSGLIKKLGRPALPAGRVKIERFNLPKGSNLCQWIEEEVKKRGGEIEKEATDKLAIYVSSDLWQLSNEINKLISFKSSCRNSLITCEDVELLVKANFQAPIFHLIDAIAFRNSQKASSLLIKFLEVGENELSILGMIVWQFRNLLLISDLLSSGANQKEIIKKTGLHPFVVQKTIRQAKNFSKEKLKKIYEKLLEADFSIKTGRLEAPLALELLVVGLCEAKS